MICSSVPVTPDGYFLTYALGLKRTRVRESQFHISELQSFFEIEQLPVMVPFSCELYWNAERAVFILQSLRRNGVRVAIDDFGTGYSSLSYLRKFPLDALKIDQSFVHRIAESLGEMTILSAIISMGRSLNLRVIAEGVETAQDLAFLQEHECHEARGYYFSRPVPADQFTALLTAERGNQPHCPLRLSVFRNASPLLPAGINQSQRFQC